MQLTAETYGDSVAMLSQIIALTENNTNQQTNEVLNTTANYFKELADFVNKSNVIINSTVSVDDYDLVLKNTPLYYCQKFLLNQLVYPSSHWID